MSPADDWPRLASYVISGRRAAGLADRQALATAAGLTYRTITKVETGRPVSPETLAAIESALGWRPDSARRVLRGEEPTLHTGTTPGRAPVIDPAGLSPPLRRIAEDPDLSYEEKVALIATAELIRQRRDQQPGADQRGA